MKRNSLRGLVGLLVAISIAFLQFGGTRTATVLADSTPQSLPFSQNWTNNVLTTNDNWSPVLGIEAYLGQDITTLTAIDPQTLLTTSALPNDLDLIANQTNPNTLTSGGVAEFDTLTDPVVALQGSGTADAPYVIIYLNTTGQSNINVAYNLRDVDGSADNSIQPVALQYRVGNTGNFTNMPTAFVADASAGPNTATLVTPVSATLPTECNNQALVQVRIITSNAAGSDEWIGVDDINVTTGAVAPAQHVVDFNGDGKSDFALTRNIGGGANGQVRWFINYSGSATTVASDWGLASDRFTPEDFDGDNKTDIAIWRPIGTGNPNGNGFFYILQSQTSTLRIEDFGQAGDDPSVVGDYNGDGKADVAVYRPGPTAGTQSTWFYRTAAAGPVTYQPWGVNGDTPAPGDYDGDGKNDFVLRRSNGAGQGQFWMLQSTAGIDSSIAFGAANDFIVPGDYDGDGKTDVATARVFVGSLLWFVRPSSTGVISAAPFASFGSGTDFPAQGDYDGDGKTDVGIWRSTGTAAFWYQGSTSGTVSVPFGQTGDYPVANFNVH